MSNGGVIGASNAATALAAPGVWNIQDVYNARLTGDWPALAIDDPSLIEFVMSNAVGGIQGAVFQDVNFVHPVGNTEGRFSVDAASNTFTILTSGFPEGHLLSVGDEVFFVEATAGDLPPPIVPDVVYYIESVPTTTTFKVSETIGGAAVSLISNGNENADRKIFKRPGASDPTIDIEIFHYDSGTFPSGLTITSDQQVGEDIDADFRLTCVVADRNLSIGTGGTLRITNNRRRFGMMVASREDVEIGPGTWIIPNFQNATPPGPQQQGHPQYRRWQVSSEGPFAGRFLAKGGNGGAGGTAPPGPTRPGGGGGGSALGGTAGAGGVANNPGGPGLPGRGTLGAPSPAGGTGGGLPGNQNIMRNLAIAYGDNITIPGPAPTVRINASGVPGGAAIQGGGGGGSGGGIVYVLHAGTFTNNGTIDVNGGAGGSSNVGGALFGVPGGAGTVTVMPVSVVL